MPTTTTTTLNQWQHPRALGSIYTNKKTKANAIPAYASPSTATTVAAASKPTIASNLNIAHPKPAVVDRRVAVCAFPAGIGAQSGKVVKAEIRPTHPASSAPYVTPTTHAHRSISPIAILQSSRAAKTQQQTQLFELVKKATRQQENYSEKARMFAFSAKPSVPNIQNITFDDIKTSTNKDRYISVLQQIAAIITMSRGHRVLPGLRCETVTAPYTPDALVGQRGVRSTTMFEAGTVLGEYEGRFRPSGEKINDYAFGGATLNEPKQSFVIDPLDGGNGVFEFMNDFRADISRPLDMSVNDRSLINVRWMTAQNGKEPHIMLIATRDIQPGDWLRIDYGERYWRARPHKVAFANVTRK